MHGDNIKNYTFSSKGAVLYLNNHLRIIIYEIMTINYIDRYKHFQSAEKFYSDGEYEKACEEYRKVLEIDPNYIEAYHGWGHSLLELEKFEDAAKKFEECIAINKTKAYFFDWGNAFLESKNYEEAIKKFEECIKLDSDLDKLNRIDFDHYAYNNIAYIFNFQGKYMKAKEKWNELLYIYKEREDIAKNCRDSEFFIDYGKILCCEFHKLEDAEHVFLIGLGIEPDDYDIMENLIHVYMQLHERDKPETEYYWKAIEQFKRAKKILEEDLNNSEDIEEKIDTLYHLGYIYSELNEYQEAERVLNEAFDLDNNNVEICKDLGILYLYNEDYEKAAKYLEMAIKKVPDDLNIMSFLAESYLRQEMIDEAQEKYEEILNIAPYNLDAIIGIGEVYNEMAEENEDEDIYDDAIKTFDKALFIDSREQKKASRILTKKDKADIYYSKGYANVESFNISNKNIKLISAWRSFGKCTDNDPQNLDAKRTKEKIKNLICHPSLIETIGTIVLFIFSVVLLVKVIIEADMKISTYPYNISIFAFLILILLITHIQHITKIKIQNIEIEKSSYQIASRKILKVKKH